MQLSTFSRTIFNIRFGDVPPSPYCGAYISHLIRFVRVARVSKKIPQKLTELRPRSHPRHLVGRRTAQKDAIKDTTSDSQVNNYFSYRWPPASLTFTIYFYLFLYLYITRITINNGIPHLKPPKNQTRRAALGRPAIKLLEGFN